MPSRTCWHLPAIFAILPLWRIKQWTWCWSDQSGCGECGCRDVLFPGGRDAGILAYLVVLHPSRGEMIQLDYSIFQLSWNHYLAVGLSNLSRINLCEVALGASAQRGRMISTCRIYCCKVNVIFGPCPGGKSKTVKSGHILCKYRTWSKRLQLYMVHSHFQSKQTDRQKNQRTCATCS